ncbi:guanine deaminase [Lapillicoccus jejuensis]|uniref:Guanine deaminase n=1 Tax=Lapillicoccus jejuensis TaxID=402171 RepID=A0A542E1P3_9MICO|nr:guanine deaminase [Lapillicoccus jejuensis]TQJ09260.1 guanine deaminase [Lapillicoccus jejuensis]
MKGRPGPLLVRGTLVDAPHDPFTTGAPLRVEDDGGLLVVDGRIADRGAIADVRRRARDAGTAATELDLRGGLVVPGFVDTHVHLPQVRVIGGLGLSLLDWLTDWALPEEARLAEPSYAAGVATDFVHGLVEAGTTTALVFGSHFAPAVDLLLQEAERVGLRTTAGLVVADRVLRPELLTTPERAHAESVDLSSRWHDRGLARYAVTPRFSLSSSPELLDACADVLRDVPGTLMTSHVNENPREIEQVAAAFPQARDYVDTYDRAGLLGPGTVLAHDVHPTDAGLAAMAAAGSAVAHCPTSNAALGSGLFPLRPHVEHGVRVALGSDVGGGTGFSLLKEALQAQFTQSLLGPDGLPLEPAHLLWLATRAGALALGLGDETGDLSVGRSFDAVHLRPRAGTTTATVVEHAPDAVAAWRALVALGTTSDVAGVWVRGRRLDGDDDVRHDHLGDDSGQDDEARRARRPVG